MNTAVQNISSDQTAIWLKIKNGDQKALGMVFHEYYNELYYYGIKIIPEPEKVKDTIQDLFVVIAESSSRLDDVKNIKAYLLVSLRRKLLRNPKKKLTIDSREIEPEAEFTFSPEDFVIHQESSDNLSNQLARCFEQLSPRQREMIMLRFYHGLKMDEIAVILDMSVQASRNLLFRALKKIRELIPDDMMGDYTNVEVFLFTIFSLQKK